MKASQLEAWVLEIVQGIIAGRGYEDARVELKREWPDAVKAARQIAGHANALGGESILWIIGVDEERGVVGCDQNEMSTWYAQVQAQFEAIAPSVRDLIVPVGDKNIAALFLDAERVPYVVKNPMSGNPGGGPVEYEVPWREGTRTRTARRHELLQLLGRVTRLPEVEVLNAHLSLSAGSSEERAYSIGLTADLYVVPHNSDRCVIPFHRCRCQIQLGDTAIEFPRIRIAPPSYVKLLSGSMVSEHNSLTIAASTEEVVLDGPGRVMLTGRVDTETSLEPVPTVAVMRAVLAPIGAPSTIHLDVTLNQCPRKGSGWAWSHKPMA